MTAANYYSLHSDDDGALKLFYSHKFCRPMYFFQQYNLARPNASYHPTRLTDPTTRRPIQSRQFAIPNKYPDTEYYFHARIAPPTIFLQPRANQNHRELKWRALILILPCLFAITFLNPHNECARANLFVYLRVSAPHSAIYMNLQNPCISPPLQSRLLCWDFRSAIKPFPILLNSFLDF